MTRSKIEWCERSDWNPIRGCTRTSPGCGGANKQGGCYAEKIAARFSKPGQPFHGFATLRNGEARWTGKVDLIEERLTEPLRWRKPADIFALSMSDLFHEKLDSWQIARVVAVMEVAQQHTFKVLTKRSDRMRGRLNSDQFWDEVNAFSTDLAFEWSDYMERRSNDYRAIAFDGDAQTPLPNVWWGVSIEGRDYLSRLDDLRATPAAVRFVSFEPLLEDIGDVDLTGIDQIIIGGESGSNSRAFDLAWMRNLMACARRSGTAVFNKQVGANAVDRSLVVEGDAPSCGLRDKKGGDPSEWPADLRVREMPRAKARRAESY